jgi:hypothetical protein
MDALANGFRCNRTGGNPNRGADPDTTADDRFNYDADPDDASDTCVKDAI